MLMVSAQVSSTDTADQEFHNSVLQAYKNSTFDWTAWISPDGLPWVQDPHIAQLDFYLDPSTTYDVQYTTDLTSGAWAVIDTVTTDSGGWIECFEDAPDQMGFFKLTPH